MTEGFRSPPPSPAGPWVTRARPPPGRTRWTPCNGSWVRTSPHPSARPRRPPRSPARTLSNGDDASTTEVAKQQAADVADTAKQAGAQVADTVKEQAGQVTAEAKTSGQTAPLPGPVGTDRAGRRHPAAGLRRPARAGRRTVRDGPELRTGRGRDRPGPAGRGQGPQAAGWLADRDPGSLLDEVRSFARKKPGTYLAIALGAGVLAGRLTRGLTAPTDDNTPTPDTPGAPGTPRIRSAPGGTRSPGRTPRRRTGLRRGPDHRPLIPVSPPVPGPGGTGASGPRVSWRHEQPNERGVPRPGIGG